MRQISIFIFIALIALFSCEKDETKEFFVADGKPAVISNTQAELNQVITEAKLGTDVLFKWNKADYGAPTEVSYTLQIDTKCDNFANPITLATTIDNKFNITTDNFNAKLLDDLKLPQHVQADLEIRVLSAIKGARPEISEAFEFQVTPWSGNTTALWILNDNGGNANAGAVYNVKGGAYEGYAYLAAGSYKFGTSRSCEYSTWGSDGDQKLSADASSSSIEIAQSGYYKINSNINADTLSYSFVLTNWGMIGSATAGNWEASTDLTYNSGTDTWEATVTLGTGALKFRANNGWDINYGPVVIADLQGTLKETDDAINISETAQYIVTLDLSKSKAPYKYSYNVVKAGEPAKLWIPGSYQNWSPSSAPVIRAVSSTAFEGFIYSSTGFGFKFTSSPDWDHINYGFESDGVLTTDGTKDGISVNEGGYYRLKADVQKLTYSVDLISSMGLVGPATAGGSDDGWNASLPMTYDVVNDVWKVTVDLAVGAVKFRANDAWTINYGPADSNSLTGQLKFDDSGAISIKDAGSYTVTADFSKSKVPYQYQYSFVKN